MNVDPNKDPEIRWLEEGLEKSLGQTKNVLTQVFKVGKNISHRLSKGFSLQNKSKTLDVNKTVNKKNSIHNTNKSRNISINHSKSHNHSRGRFQSKVHQQKQPLNKVVAKAVSKASKVNKDLTRVVSLDKVRS